MVFNARSINLLLPRASLPNINTRVALWRLTFCQKLGKFSQNLQLLSAPPKSGSCGMTRKTYRLDCRMPARQSGQAHGVLCMACEARHGEVYEFIYLSENSILPKNRCISLTPATDMKQNSCKIWAPQNIGRDAHACARLSMTEGKNARKVSDVQSRQYCRAERAGFTQRRTAQGRSVTML